MSSFSAGPDGVKSFPKDGNSVIKDLEIRVERTCLKNSKKTEHQKLVEKKGGGT